MISKDELAKIVGKENVSNAPADLLKYSKDRSLVPPGMPELVVCPTSSEKVSEVLKWANKNNVPVVPVSSKEHFNGGAVPRQGGVVIRMRRVHSHRASTLARKFCAPPQRDQPPTKARERSDTRHTSVAHYFLQNIS